MNIGEFIIKIGTQGDTKELDKTIEKLKEAEKETKREIKLQKDLAKATSEEEKKQIKANYARQVQIDKLEKAKKSQVEFNNILKNGISTALKMAGAIGVTVTMLDRMGNSLLKANQMYTNFGQQTGISITRLNRIAGVARLAGMNMTPEQVAGDVSELQHKIFRFERFGENAETFGKLGINPRGMKADNLILSLRNALKNQPGQVKSEYLAELGLSQEWLTVLNLTNEQFKDFLKTSNKLQLTEKERKELAKYTYQQQKNNMRWELAKQKLLIAVMPLVQQMMEAASKAALTFSEFLDKNPEWLNVFKDILILLSGTAILKTVKAISNMAKLLGAITLGGLGGGLLKGGAGAVAGATVGGVAKKGGLLGNLLASKGLRRGIGKVFGKGAAKWAARTAAGHTFAGGLAATGVGAPLAGLLEMGLWGWGLFSIGKDIFELLKNKDEREKNEEENSDLDLEPAETGSRYAYHTMNSNMTNNFFNNPQPAVETLRELVNVQSMFLAEQNR